VLVSKKHNYKADERDARTYGCAHCAEDVGVERFFGSGAAAHQQKSDDNQCHRHAHEDEILFSERTCVGFLFFLYFFHIYFCGFFIV